MYEISNAKPTPYKTRIRKSWGGKFPSKIRSDASMSKGQVNFEKDNEYYTPKRVVDYFGKFDYDPATTKEKAIEFGVEHYDTIETDGLKQDWSKYKRIWVNPPFSDKHKFVEKAYQTYRENPDIYIYIYCFQ